ncbi:hypothetical protein [Mycobacterium shimoidei]|uniref:hypothetical protein n=1 Tax=Mycobacterium shimoidei TaxID=29313 RepID=UPI0008493089|nr:hypothetical protein [Mycobacterium shimoidei]MCV7257032.1 hypothetical protein [Mycobacterium shimoidei]ODR07411.1 hypothetical protein BHQ16_21275 [Mycobacterium shimoidei]ORW77091.1 hypothetical protein AWC26_19850 [Mycobacterium shimoidei]
MLGAIAIVPSAPVLVPELAGAAAEELTDLRTATIAAAASLPQRWIAVGVADDAGVYGPRSVGTFAGFGADVTVGLSPGLTGQPADLPLCALFTAWLREQAQPDASAEVRVFPADLAVDAAQASGRQLRAEIEPAAEPIGVLIVADGATTLSAAAPGGYRPDDIEVQLGLDEALACGDVVALTKLPYQIVGRVAFQVLAGLTEPTPRSAKELYRGSPYGVGYFAGIWQP